MQWLVITTCPTHKKPVQILIEATTGTAAEKQAVGKSIDCPYPPSHKFTITEVDAVTTYPWKPPAVSIAGKMGVITYTPPKKRVETEAEAPTQLQSSHRRNGVVDVTLIRGNEQLSVIYPKNEVQRYDKLVAIAKRMGQDTLINGLLAFLVAHGGATKSLATGFLQASNFKDATVSSVGEAMSRLKRDNIIYTFHSASLIFTRYPLGASQIKGEGIGEIERTVTSEILGEPVYGIPETTRIKILERSKFEPHLAWWRMLKAQPALKAVRAKIAYEWVQIISATPRFRSAEDYKYYGPYEPSQVDEPSQVVKIPLVFAYLLVRLGYAKWLTAQKEEIVKIETLLKATPIEKVKRQATLF